jgi:hypothetical protein
MSTAVTNRRGRAGRIRPDSPAFTVLLGMLASLPTFGIDMILPTLSTTAIALQHRRPRSGRQ